MFSFNYINQTTIFIKDIVCLCSGEVLSKVYHFLGNILEGISYYSQKCTQISSHRITHLFVAMYPKNDQI